MSFPKRREFDGGKYVEVEFGRGKKLVRNAEIGHLLTRPNRGIFVELIDRAAKLSGEQEKNGMKMEMVGRKIGSSGRSRYYYRMQLEDNIYFVKRTPTKELQDFGGGAGEITAMSEAGKLLEGISGVSVLEYHVGFEDNYETFLVSRWDDGLRENLEDYMGRIRLLPDKQAEYEYLIQKKDEIVRILRPHFYDVDTHNMAYDTKYNKIIIFDLIKKPAKDAN